MENVIVRKKIDDISMMKGIGILLVVFAHLGFISGCNSNFPIFGEIMTPIEAPMMLMFFLLSGYVSSPHNNKIGEDLLKRTKALLLPYYRFSVVMLVIYSIIYLGIEHQSLGWYADGALGILLQLQSFHFFDPEISGIHPMFYGVIIGWYLFQMAASSFIFIPSLRWLQGKPHSYKLIFAAILIGLGTVLYLLNLQGLNGEFFPPVCKIIILPNIPGIAGVLLLGNWLSDIGFLKFDEMKKKRILLTVVVSILLLAVLYFTDDCLYDFPIGKWGTYGALGYFSATIYSIALFEILGFLCYWIKRMDAIKNFLVFWGDHSLDVLIVHFFFGYLIAYLAGFWVNFLSEPVTATAQQSILRFILLMILVPVLCYTYIQEKSKNSKNIKNNSKEEPHERRKGKSF